MKYMLLDGLNLARRFYHGMEGITNAHGQPVGMLIGWTNALCALVKKYNPDIIVGVFEDGPSISRTAIFPEYKAHRHERPEDFSLQLGQLRQLLPWLPVHFVEFPGVEADDVIANMAVVVLEQKLGEVMVVSSDKDFACLLLHPSIRLIRPGNGTTQWSEWGAEEAHEKWGVTPAQVPDLLALMGDDSDGVPGVPSIGPKKAALLLNQYGSISSLREDVRNGLVKPPGVQAALQQHWDAVERNVQLITLQEVDVVVPVERAQGDYREAIALLQRLGLAAQAGKITEHHDALYRREVEYDA